MCPPSARESLARLGRLVRKELSEILRDRRTIITLFLMPLLLYPLLSVAFQQFFLASAGQLDRKRGPEFRFGFATDEQGAAFARILAFAGRQEKASSAPKIGAKESAPSLPRWKGYLAKDLEQSLREGTIDLAIRLPKETVELALEHQEPSRDLTFACEVKYLKGTPLAQAALVYVERRFAAANNRALEARLNLPGWQDPVILFLLARTALEQPGGDSLVSLAALVPLILILMTITGAVYPAIDLTAGERERGTLEILVAAPVPRLGLLFAKYVTVVTISVLTALVNLVTMMFTLVFSGLAPVVFGDKGLSPLLLIQLFGLLLLFAAFFSALLLSLTSFARSFKEAQAYLIPLMLASLGPGLIGMMPGLELEGPLAAVPLVNIVLLARDLVQGGADPGWATIVVLTTLAYAAAAIALAARIFGAEGVLYNEQTGWSDLLRRPTEARPTATVASAFWCLALMIPLHFALQGIFRLLFARAEGDPPASTAHRLGQFAALTVISLLLFVVLPGISAYLGRVRLGTGFGLKKAPLAGYVGGLVLGLSLWPLVFQILNWLLADKVEQLQKVFGSALEGLGRDRQTLLPIMIGVLVIQALVEELFFRGYLFAALRERFQPLGPRNQAWGTIGLSALLFGLFHVILEPTFGLERLLPSTLLGLVLGWVCWTTGSVVPSMLLHACHNALLNVLPLFSEIANGLENKPWPWLAGGTVASCMGMALVWLGQKKEERGTT